MSPITHRPAGTRDGGQFAGAARDIPPATLDGHREPVDGFDPALVWKDGRRIYIRSTYGSPLGDALYKAGASWDADKKARYVGTAKWAARIRDIVAEHAEQETAKAQARDGAASRVREIIGRGHRIALQPWETKSREDVKNAGGVWHPGSEAWYLPDAKTHARVAAQVEERRATVEREKARQDAERAKTREEGRRQRAAERESAAKSAAAARAERVIATTNRTLVEPRVESVGTIEFVKCSRKDAEREADRRIGTVIVDHDDPSRRWLITGARPYVRYTIDDEFDGWDCRCTIVAVEETDAERVPRMARQARHRLDTVVRAVRGRSDATIPATPPDDWAAGRLILDTSTIYGTGVEAHLDARQNRLAVLVRNGADGDDWSRNTVPGGYVVLAPVTTAEAQEWAALADTAEASPAP